MTTIALSPEVESVKARLKHIWMAGDYDRFSRYMESGARDFYERLQCRSWMADCWTWAVAPASLR